MAGCPAGPGDRVAVREGVPGVWAAIRYRRAQAVGLALLSALITACAVFAPLYDSYLEQAL